MKKRFIPALFFVFTLFNLSALDLSFRIDPIMSFPMGEDYKTGFTGLIQADADMFGFLTAGLEGFASVQPSEYLTSNMTLFGGGVGVGGYYYPISRLYLGAGGAFGVYNATAEYIPVGEQNKEKNNGLGFYWRAYGEVGFRVSPTVTISGIGGFSSFNIANKSPLLKSPFAGISLKITVPVGKNKTGGIGIDLVQDDSAFPLFMSAYRECPLGSVVLSNTEGADIDDVHVSFRAGKYTASTYESGVIDKLRKYATAEIPLYADFSTEILKFSENGKISGEIVVSYNFLGKRKEAVQNVVIDVYNRNAFLWTDPASLSAYVSSNTPEILQFSKSVAGLARNSYRTGINKNLENAIALMEALRIAGIKHRTDEATPYSTFFNSSDIDAIQYPLQTMNMLGGDYDELGILLASCLQSVGVPTGFLATEEDFIVLVNMQITPQAAANHFEDVNTLIIDGDNVYFGLSMAHFEEGFSISNETAGKFIKSVNEEGFECLFVDVPTAWTYYQPAVYTGSSGLFQQPKDSSITSAYNLALQQYIETEIEGVISKARRAGDVNKVGLALVRLGRNSEAKKEFAKSDALSPMLNLANVLLSEKDYQAAKKQFQKVLEKYPDNETAIKGIEKADTQLGL